MAVRQTSGRTLAGVGAILLLIVLLALLVGSLAGVVSRWPVVLQALFYLVVGIIWIAPLKPLLRWIETGRFRLD